MKQIAATAAVVLATLTAVLLMWQLSEILVLFIVSLAVAAMVRSPAEALIRRGWPSGLAILLVYGLGIGLPVALLALIGWRAVVEVDALVNGLIATYVRLYSALQSGGGMVQALAGRLPDPTSLTGVVNDAESAAFVASVVRTVQSIGTIGSQLLIAVVVSIYWTSDRLRFERLWLSLLPAEQRARARTQWRKLESGTGAYLRSELAQIILAGAVLSFGFWLLGYRFPVLLAFGAAVAWAIPLVGGLLGMALVVLAGWSNGVVDATLAALLAAVVYAILEFYVEPRLYTRERYWRVLVLLVMLAMTDAFGLLGLLVAPPLATALQLWLNDLLTPPVAAAETASSLDLSDVHAKLEAARLLIHQEGEPPSPRIVNLFDRLEQLVEEVEQAEAVTRPASL